MLAACAPLFALGGTPRPPVKPLAATTVASGAWWRPAQAYLRPPGALAATAFPGADVLELYHLRYEQVEPDGLSRQLVQRVFVIRSQFGARTFGAEDFWYDASRWSFHLIRGEVIRPDGQRQPVTDGGDVNPEAEGNRARLLRFPPLTAGERINIIYSLTPTAAASWKPLGYGYIGDLFAFRANYPVARVRYVLRSPRPIATDAVRVRSIHTSRRNGNYVWDWSGGPLPAFWREPDGPSITDQSPYVQTGEFSSWQGLAQWYSRELAAEAPLTAAFRARLRQLAPPRATALGTVQAVWHYLARHLDYWGDETGLHGFLPSPPPAVLKAGRGDCKDGALLMATWLRADGVPADLALIRTWSMGAVANGAATIAAFDHAIVYVPQLHLWLDTTAPSLHAGELPATDQGALALIVRPSQTRLVQVPILPAHANQTVQTFRLSAAGAQTWRLNGQITATGTRANRLREKYGAPGARRALVASWLRQRFPDIEVRSARMSGDAWADARAELDFTARIPRAEFPDPARQPPAFFRHHFAARYAAPEHRRQAQRIPVRWRLETQWTVPVPACAAAVSPVAVHSRFGQLQIAQSCSGRQLRTIFTLAQTGTEIPAGRYGAYRRFWETVDARLSRPLAPARGRAQVVLASAQAAAPGAEPAPAAPAAAPAPAPEGADSGSIR